MAEGATSSYAYPVPADSAYGASTPVDAQQALAQAPVFAVVAPPQPHAQPDVQLQFKPQGQAEGTPMATAPVLVPVPLPVPVMPGHMPPPHPYPPPYPPGVYPPPYYQPAMPQPPQPPQPVAYYAPQPHYIPAAVPAMQVAEPLPRVTYIPAEPATLPCQHCKVAVHSTVRTAPGAVTWLAAAAICFLGGWGCCFIPFCIPQCMDATHICPTCGSVLGVHRAMS